MAFITPCGNTILCMYSCSLGLGTTLFERLVIEGAQPCLLDTQYRMHEGIAEFPSQHFYASRLRTGIAAQDRPLPKVTSLVHVC